MPFFRRRTPNAIDAGTTIVGMILSENSWVIAGKVVGDVTAGGDVTIERTAEIKGNVTGENVRVAGKVTGNIIARKHMHLSSTCSIDGDISYLTIRIEDGAFIAGKMLQKEKAATGVVEVRTNAEASHTQDPERSVEQSERSVEQTARSPSAYTPRTPVDEPSLPIRNNRVMIQ